VAPNLFFLNSVPQTQKGWETLLWWLSSTCFKIYQQKSMSIFPFFQLQANILISILSNVSFMCYFHLKQGSQTQSPRAVRCFLRPAIISKTDITINFDQIQLNLSFHSIRTARGSFFFFFWILALRSIWVWDPWSKVTYAHFIVSTYL
jgi:hypothetical protein